MCFLKSLIGKHKKVNSLEEKNECLSKYFDGCSLIKRIAFEILFLLCLAVPLAFFLIKYDFFEWLYGYTRVHESWELDEWLSVGLALLLVSFVVAQRRLYVILNIHKELVSAHKKIKEKEEQECRDKRMVALGSMASGLAHEVNNALQPVLGLGEFVREGLVEQNNDKHTAYMNTILNGAYHARGILENVLQYTHEKTIYFEDYWVRALLLHTFNFCIDVMPDGTHCVWYGLNKLEDDNERLMLRCNDTCMRQMIFNLMKNASDAMDGTGDIIIRVSRCEKEDALEGSVPAICIEISDTGCGIDEKTLQRIFEPFFTTKDISEGTGLGLTSVYSLVQQHEGEIKVDSEVGKGTTFKLIFPVSVEDRNKVQKGNRGAMQ